MRNGKAIIYFIWILAVIFLGIITMYSHSKVDSFLGLTESQETNMNYPFSIQIKKIYVNLGQEVKKGEKLAEVVRLDVDTKLSSKRFQIAKLMSKQELKREKLQSELEILKIRENKDLSEFDYKIKILKEKNMPRDGVVTSRFYGQNNLAQMKIATLEKKREDQKRFYEAKKSNILTVITNIDNPIEEQVKQLESKIDSLKKAGEIITIYAPYDANIGTINKTEGESLKPFTSIINLHPLYPTYVTGYIHEDIQTTVSIGQKVIITPISSISDNHEPVYGEIQSVSTKIVNFPTRLKKFKIISLWGYSVLIKVSKNQLKLGQRVTIAKEAEHNDTVSKLFDILHSIKIH